MLKYIRWRVARPDSVPVLLVASLVTGSSGAPVDLQSVRSVPCRRPAGEVRLIATRRACLPTAKGARSGPPADLAVVGLAESLRVGQSRHERELRPACLLHDLALARGDPPARVLGHAHFTRGRSRHRRLLGGAAVLGRRLRRSPACRTSASRCPTFWFGLLAIGPDHDVAGCTSISTARCCIRAVCTRRDSRAQPRLLPASRAAGADPHRSAAIAFVEPVPARRRCSRH